MTLTACKDKPGICEVLYMGTQQRFHIFLRIGHDLLEFINSDDTGFVGPLQIIEYLSECCFRRTDVPQLQIETRIADRIECNSGLQRFYTVPKMQNGLTE